MFEYQSIKRNNNIALQKVTNSTEVIRIKKILELVMGRGIAAFLTIK